jgi:hypothetical protein
MAHCIRRSLLAAALVVVAAGCSEAGGDDAADDKSADTPPLALADAAAGAPDFGDDEGDYANDGECDDMRFAGPGMTDTPLLEEDIRHDATDCRTAFEQGRLTLKGGKVARAALTGPAPADVSRIQWGDDGSEFANDGECDDKRFTGAGMTTTPLLDSDINHDATDCRVAFEQGRLSLRE